MDRAAVVTGPRSPAEPMFNVSTSTLAFNRNFINNAKGILHLAEIVCGMLVWILVGGTHYSHLSSLCWVMFVAVLLWVLTLCLFVIFLIGAHHRITQVPWTTLSLCFDCSAAALYLVSAVAEALAVHQAVRGRHDYNCWAASAFFASLTTLCFAGSSYLSYGAWRSSREGK